MADTKTETVERTMDVLTFVSQMTGSLAWPVAAIVIAAIFRSQIAGLLAKVRKLTWGDKAVDFADKLDKAEAAAATVTNNGEVVPMLPKIEIMPQVIHGAMPDDRFEQLVTIAPGAAILETWGVVEKGIDGLAKHFSVKIDKRKPLDMIDILHKNKLINVQGYVILDEMRQLRNAAAHNEPVTSTDAYRFKRLADTVMKIMQID